MPTLTHHGFAATGITRLDQFALIAAAGADATDFLHSQLTSDIKSLAQNHATLAGYCSAKGRLLGTMLVIKNTDGILLEVPQDLQEVLQKRLQMFVMRAKVKLEDVTGGQSIFGIFGSDSLGRLAEWFPETPAAPYAAVTTSSGTLLRLADSNGIARYQWIVARTLADQIWPALANALPVVAPQSWTLSDIHAGIPNLSMATQEKFVPQMINYELIGGVSFKKGCYPGQEIVARTHYLGRQKRRMMLAHIDGSPVQNGMEVFCADDLTQPCGMVVNSAANPAGGSDCLIEIKTAFSRQGNVQLQSGAVCQWQELPYELPDDAAAQTP